MGDKQWNAGVYLTNLKGYDLKKWPGLHIKVEWHETDRPNFDDWGISYGMRLCLEDPDLRWFSVRMLLCYENKVLASGYNDGFFNVNPGRFVRSSQTSDWFKNMEDSLFKKFQRLTSLMNEVNSTLNQQED